MFFQIALSPVNSVKMQQPSSTEDVTILKLAPFTPNPKIFFENICVGTTSVKKLIIQNPSLSKNKLTISKLPSADRHLSLNWNEAEVEAQDETILEFFWTPKEEGTWREILSITDSRNLKRDVPIILKSVSQKGRKRIGKKQTKLKPTVVATPAIKKFRSPKNNKKKVTPEKIIEKRNMPKLFYSINESNKENSPIICQKKSSHVSIKPYQQSPENLSFSRSFSEKINRLDDSSFLSPKDFNFKCDNISQTPIRRETYAINKSSLNDLINNSDQFNDSLELEQKLNNLDITSEVTLIQQSSVNELNIDSPEVSFSENNKRRSDDFLVQKLLSDSFNFTTGTTANKLPNFLFTLNDTEVIDEVFHPNNCSTETKYPGKVNKNNSSTPKELFKLNSTYELSSEVKNNSPETCVHNLSGGTYSVENVSSSSTYNLLSPDETLISPVCFPDLLNSFNFSGINARTALSCILEEEQPPSAKKTSSASGFSVAGTKRRSEMVFSVSPPKRAFIKPKSPKPQKNINSSWNQKLEKTEKIRRKSISHLKLNLSNCSTKSKSSTSCVIQTNCNIDPFLIAAMHHSNTSPLKSNLDPFISSTFYYEETWLEKQIMELKKWLNALLVPPSELDTKAERRKIDVAKLWQDCIKKDLVYAPTKEKVSSKYHTSFKLEILRKSAKNLFHSFEMRNVLSKIAITIENNLLSIREDKNLHLDVGLQSHILNLLLCYNPLWLRIGLETVYNESIQLESNSDVIGLSTFIMLRFFYCSHLLPKNKQSTHLKYLPKYGPAFKKFTLKKFLMLVYFLDQAKAKKIIFHDPCLFCKDAPVKESKELLLSFSRELLSAVGDVTKFLRRFGYEVSYKQNHIDEFDYAVKNLGIDLRDGIRLTKVMEIILLRNDLTNQLRCPAISRLQKIHNVKLSFQGLTQAGFNIAGDITPKDIVDGHREKTLSFLWQIIYKFQAPRFTAAAIKIQMWWKSLSIVIRRKILDRPRQKRIIAAIKIQQFYRSWKLMLQQNAQFLLTKKSAIIIQRFVRITFLKRRDRVQFLVKKQAAVIIQQRFRAQMLMKERRKYYLKLKNTAVLIQRRFRSRLCMKQTRNYYTNLKEIVVKIQRNFRAKKMGEVDRNIFLKKRNAAIVIQKHFRVKQQMKIIRNNYLRTKEIIIKIQQKLKATILMRKIRSNYLQKRSCVILLQRRYRANILKKKVQKEYLEKRTAVIKIQQYFRANLLMKQIRYNYLQYKNAAIIIQQRFRAYLAMKIQRINYLKLKLAVIIVQEQYRAQSMMKICKKNYSELKIQTIFVQRLFRAKLLMKKDRENYLQQRYAAIKIQQRFRAYLAMKINRTDYIKLKEAVTLVQNRYRAQTMMKICKQNYSELKIQTIFVQTLFRAKLLMKKDRLNYLQQRYATIKIQQRFRAYLIMKITRQNYLQQKYAAIIIQQRFRAHLAMKIKRTDYIKLKEAVTLVQNRYRAQTMMKICKQNYSELKIQTIFVQRLFRAKLLMKKDRLNYLQQKYAAIIIQQRCRAHLAMKINRTDYLKLKEAVTLVQNQYRALTLMKICKKNYSELKIKTIFVQRLFRAKLLMKKDRENYLQQRYATIKIQQRFRAYLIMKITRQNYLQQKYASIIIQQRFKAHLRMKINRTDYLTLKQAVILVQNRYRAQTVMKICKKNYSDLKIKTIFVQRLFRAKLLMKKERGNYLQHRTAVTIIQQRFREYLIMKITRQSYLKTKSAVIILQQHFRANVAMKIEREKYLQIKRTVIFLQDRFRRNISMKKYRNIYLQQNKGAIVIQQYFKAYLRAKIERENYISLRKNVIIIQKRFRANLAMKQDRKIYNDKKLAAIRIQRWFRNILIGKHREHYLLQKKSVCIIQRRFREYLLMKKQRNKYIQMKKSSILIQKYFRSSILKKKYRQDFLLNREIMIAQKEIKKRQYAAATTIQAAWRGYKCRKGTTVTMLQIRQRSIDAAKNALPEKGIRQRNLDAIQILMYQSSMKEIIRALTLLDFSTRLFPNLCIEESNEITERLYVLLVCTNRSVPDTDISILCVSVLTNLYKYPPTSGAVWKTEYIEPFLFLLLHWSNKDGPLFIYACTLLWLFTQNPEYCKVIKKEKNLPKILEKTFQQCERRQKMLTRMRNVPATLYTQKNILPSLNLDWGISSVKHPRFFQNPIFAIKCLMKKLNIEF